MPVNQCRPELPASSVPCVPHTPTTGEGSAGDQSLRNALRCKLSRLRPVVPIKHSIQGSWRSSGLALQAAQCCQGLLYHTGVLHGVPAVLLSCHTRAQTCWHKCRHPIGGVLQHDGGEGSWVRGTRGAWRCGTKPGDADVSSQNTGGFACGRSSASRTTCVLSSDGVGEMEGRRIRPDFNLDGLALSTSAVVVSNPCATPVMHALCAALTGTFITTNGP
jgi:hypothetical protein